MSEEPGRTRASARLTRPSDFERVFKSRQRVADGLFLLIACRNGLGQARLGCAFSKRRLATAVARNRLKRIARESFRAHCATLAGLDIVVSAQKDLGATGNAELRSSLDNLWKKIAACVTS